MPRGRVSHSTAPPPYRAHRPVPISATRCSSSSPHPSARPDPDPAPVPAMPATNALRERRPLPLLTGRAPPQARGARHRQVVRRLDQLLPRVRPQALQPRRERGGSPDRPHHGARGRQELGTVPSSWVCNLRVLRRLLTSEGTGMATQSRCLPRDPAPPRPRAARRSSTFASPNGPQNKMPSRQQAPQL